MTKAVTDQIRLMQQREQELQLERNEWKREAEQWKETAAFLQKQLTKTKRKLVAAQNLANEWSERCKRQKTEMRRA